MQKEISLPRLPQSEDIWTKISKKENPILIYGMGNGADKLLRKLDGLGKAADDFFASDGFVRGHSFHGKRVLSFSEAKEKYTEDFTILLSFATGIKDVMTLISDIANNHELYIPDMPVVDEEYFTYEFYNAHYEEIVKAQSSLCDDLSKCLFSSIIAYKLSAEHAYLDKYTSTTDEMYELFDCNKISCAIDAGAYNGDTAKEMISHFKSLQKIHAFEPDPKNCKKLLKLAESTSSCEIHVHDKALWSHEDVASFSSSNNRNSSLLNASHKHNNLEIGLVAIDAVINEKVDYIKYDVEGAEMEALHGSFKTIEKYRPVMLVSAYHKSEDIFSLINVLASKLENYKFYLRRKHCYPAWEINLFAIPDEKSKQ